MAFGPTAWFAAVLGSTGLLLGWGALFHSLVNEEAEEPPLTDLGCASWVFRSCLILSFVAGSVTTALLCWVRSCCFRSTAPTTVVIHGDDSECGARSGSSYASPEPRARSFDFVQRGVRVRPVRRGGGALVRASLAVPRRRRLLVGDDS